MAAGPRLPKHFPDEVIHQVLHSRPGSIITQDGRPLGIITSYVQEGPHTEVRMEIQTGGMEAHFSFNNEHLDGFDVLHRPVEPLKILRSYLVPEKKKPKTKEVTIGMDEALSPSGGFYIPPELATLLSKKMSLSTKMTFAREPEVKPWAFEHRGNTYQVNVASIDRQESILMGKDAQDVMFKFMNATLFMTSAQMTTDPEQASDLYWKALQILESLGLLTVDAI